MTRKTKKILIISVLLLFCVAAVGVGLKYFPFTRVVKLPASEEREFVNSQQIYTRAPASLYFDFETDPNKATPAGLYKGIAHSGQFSVKAFGKNSYSLTIERKAEEVGIRNLKAVALSAWVYVLPTKDEIKGTFVFTASNELGVNVVWQGISVGDPGVPRGQWFKISGYIDLSSVTFKPGYKLQVYFWNTSSSDILIDDYYIVFGGPVDRRGDSALVDMTRENSYTPRINFPPWTVSFLSKSPSAKAIPASWIPPGAPVAAGRFTGNNTDDLITTTSDGKLSLITWCDASGEFRQVVLSNAAVAAPLGKITKILSGQFLPGNSSQMLLCGDKKWAVGTVESSDDPCKSGNPPATTLRLLHAPENISGSVSCGDFNGDRITEILIIAPDGSWKMMTVAQEGKNTGSLKTVAGQNPDVIPEWNTGQYELSVHPGHFLAGIPADLILTVTREKSTGRPAYTFRKYSKGYWLTVFPSKQGYCGLNIGTDTLRPSDRFLLLNQKPGALPRVYRYDREWRYDLKEIQFNDTAFRILSAIDFQGYEKDHNPKYYEFLELLPGNFISPAEPGFMVIGHVAPERHYQSILPDFISLYLPEEKKKN